MMWWERLPDPGIYYKSSDFEEAKKENANAKKRFMTHELKIRPQYYKEVLNGNKTFELRKDDRCYKIGDTLRLKEFKFWQTYTGRTFICTVKYILRDCEKYGLKKGVVILGIA